MRGGAALRPDPVTSPQWNGKSGGSSPDRMGTGARAKTEAKEIHANKKQSSTRLCTINRICEEIKIILHKK